MIEEWKDIKGYEGLYQVSNLGRVRNVKYNRLLKLVCLLGYMTVNLSKNNHVIKKRVHRLVAEAFIPNPDNKPTVNHIDEDKTNNRVDNLEWATIQENNTHGSRVQKTSKAVKAIDIATGEYNIYCSQSQCGRELGLKSSNINRALKGRLRQVGGYVFEYA